jgi:hypothetical protein
VLEASRFLIVICSPNAAQSQYLLPRVIAPGYCSHCRFSAQGAAKI